MRSESQVLALLAKQAKANKAAAAEFEAAKRDDLREREEAQLAVLNEYISLIPTIPESEIAEAVTTILANLKANGAKLHYGVCTMDSSPSPFPPSFCLHRLYEHTSSFIQTIIALGRLLHALTVCKTYKVKKLTLSLPERDARSHWS